MSMLATSEPERGSDSAKAEIALPARVFSSHFFWSFVPNRLIAPVPSPCMAKAKSASPSCRASVSRVMQSVRTSSGAGLCRVDRSRLQPAVASELFDQLAAGGVDFV